MSTHIVYDSQLHYPWTYHGTWSSAIAYARTQSRKGNCEITIRNGDDGRTVTYIRGQRRS